MPRLRRKAIKTGRSARANGVTSYHTPSRPVPTRQPERAAPTVDNPVYDTADAA